MKKIFAVLLSVIFVLTAIFAGCSKNTPEKPALDGENGDGAKPGETDTPEKTPERFTPNLPDMDFDGYEFRAIVPINNLYGTFTFSVEEENGDLINDAIYKRNKYIEDRYNVVFSQVEIVDNIFGMAGMFKTSVMSGSDDFDLGAIVDYFSLVTQGYALTVDKLPYLDITQPWYAQHLNELYTIGNKRLVAYSDECASMYDAVVAYCFNKELIKNLGLENPYELVKNNQWTYDKFFGMCRAAAADLDGDGKMTDSDRYGILSQFDELLAPFWVCAGVRTVVKDKDDMLVLNFEGNERLFDILDKIHQNIYKGAKIFFDTHPESGDKLTTYDAGNIAASGFIDVSRQQFENNLGLFITARMGRIPNLRAMEADFGIIPYPQAYENSGKYYAMTNGGWLKVVPNHAPNPERTSIIMEALAAESRNVVVPALKETSLKTKFARDDESAEMVDIIFDNVFEDLGATVFWATVRNALINEVRGKGNFASVAEKQSKSLAKMLNGVNESVMNLD